MAVMAMERPIPGVGLSWRQYGGASGIIGVVLFVVGIVMQGEAPMLNDPVADVKAWYADNGQTYLIADFIIGIGVIIFLIPFFTILRSVLTAAEGGLGHWSRLSFYGAIFFLLLGGAASSFNGALAVGEGDLGDEVVEALQYANFYAFGGLSLALVLFFVGTAMVIRGSSVFWGWLAWLCLALAIVAVVGAASPIEGDPEGALSWISFASFIGLGVVVLALSAGMLTVKEPVTPGSNRPDTD